MLDLQPARLRQLAALLRVLANNSAYMACTCGHGNTAKNDDDMGDLTKHADDCMVHGETQGKIVEARRWAVQIEDALGAVQTRPSMNGLLTGEDYGVGGKSAGPIY